MWSSLVRRAIPLTTVAERLETADNDFLDLHWSTNLAHTVPDYVDRQANMELADSDSTTDKVSDVVCIFHGLAGSINSSYASAAFKNLQTLGFAVVFMHFRGCSSEPNRQPYAYHSGHTEDIDFLVKTVKARCPDCRIHALGFSLGANALLKYMGETGDDSLFTSAVAVAPPFILQSGADKMNRGFSKIYQHHLLTRMKKQLAEKRELYPEHNLPDETIVSHLNTFWEFDDKITGPLHGFKDADDYYTQSSCRQYLPQIKRPTHIIYALDDPFFEPSVVPEEAELPEDVNLELPTAGGHVGFVSGPLPWKANYWLDEYVPQLLARFRDQSILKTNNKGVSN